VGVIKGKLRYLAPEIAMGEEPDYRADVFCCGIVLFEMLTGEAMFAPRTDLEAIEMATAARVRSPCTANPNVPPDLEDIVMKALRRDRNERYQSAKELYTALRLFLNHHHPAYVGSELGDLMRAKFTSEIAEDRRLDDRAEQIMERAHSADVDPTEGVPEGELAGLIESVETTRPGKYRQIVTRAGIPLNQAGGGDGSQDDLQAEGDATEAHDQGEGDDPAFEPTMRAMNPLLPRDQDTRDVAPTVAAPPPTRPEIEPAIDPHDDSADELTASGEALVPDPAAAPVVVVTPTQRGQWTTLIFALAAALVISGGVWLGFAVVPAEPPPAKAAVVEPSPPAPPAPAPEPSTQLAVTPTVAAPSGTIILIDAEGEITSSDGRVEGTTITGVPLGKKIEIKVDRRRGTPWSTEVSLTSAEPVEIEVPKPARKQGTLWVNSFPYADVYVNGRSRGETPLELKLDADTYTILLKRPDGKIQKKRVTVKAGTKSSIRVKWPN
jgi:hypothetical protein